jgi:hypothetical protein
MTASLTGHAASACFALGSASLCTALLLSACGEEGLLPTTVDPGPNFNISEVVFDEDFFHCNIEPILVARSCAAGDPAQGDAANGCHANVTSYKLATYAPLVADTCVGNNVAAGQVIPPEARQNYQLSQVRMKRDASLAPLLTRPTGQASHPRVIFDSASIEADTIREWANQFSSQ